MPAKRHALLLLLALLLPAVAAAPIASTGVSTVHVDWRHLGRIGRCDELTTLNFQQTNSRILLEMQSSTQGIGTSTTPPLTKTECAMPFSVVGGVFTNPCQLLRGETPTPAVIAGDPYLHHVNGWHYSKLVNFPDGGRAEFRLALESPTWVIASGWCEDGTTIGTWAGWFRTVPVG